MRDYNGFLNFLLIDSGGHGLDIDTQLSMTRI